MDKVVLLGAGNLATNLGCALQTAGINIATVYSRTEASARTLAKRLNTNSTCLLDAIPTDADVYFYALKDDALPQIAAQIRTTPHALHVHTAGSMDINVLASHQNFGVFYPLQTFSKTRIVPFNNIPILIEANTPAALARLHALAALLSNTITEATSAQRRSLHLAAVFACNFTNRMYAIAHDITTQAGLPFEVLLPLIDETARKVHDITPAQAQTGPAIRYDKNVLDKHLSMLKDEDKRRLYELISRSIHQASSHNFATSLSYERQQAERADAFYRQHVEATSIERFCHDTPADMALQHQDIDVRITRNNATITISEKFRENDYEDLYVEIYSKYPTVRGWIHTGQAQVLAYFVPNKVYWVSERTLRPFCMDTLFPAIDAQTLERFALSQSRSQTLEVFLPERVRLRLIKAPNRTSDGAEWLTIGVSVPFATLRAHGVAWKMIED